MSLSINLSWDASKLVKMSSFILNPQIMSVVYEPKTFFPFLFFWRMEYETET